MESSEEIQNRNQSSIPQTQAQEEATLNRNPNPDPSQANHSLQPLPITHSDSNRRKPIRRTEEPLPPCVDKCVTSMESCTEGMVRFNQRQADKRVNGRFKVEQDGNRVEVGDPTWVKYGMVPIVCIILSWIFIVYVWRLCTPMIRQNSQALGSRATGIVLLVLFLVIWLLTMWSYIKVLSTQPGFAKDHVAESDPPPKEEDPYNYSVPYPTSNPQTYNDNLQPSNQNPAPPSSAHVHPQLPSAPVGHVDPVTSIPGPQESLPSEQLRSESEEANVEDSGMAAITGPIGVGLVAASKEAEEAERDLNRNSNSSTTEQDPTLHSPSTRSQFQPQTPTKLPSSSPTTASPPPVAIAPHGNAPRPNPNTAPWEFKRMPEPKRAPPTHAVLDPIHRYCYKCKRTKPPRTHHCRRCGQCILKMDHHCPWVGGCVGARNHKFFFNFVFWVTMLELLLLFSTAVLFSRGSQHRSGYRDWKLDGYLISLFPLIGMFTLFTGALLITHTYLFIRNLTTIEHMSFERMTSREAVILDQYFKSEFKGGGNGGEKPSTTAEKLDLSCGMHLKAKKLLKTKWNQEWGELRKEGNLWWIGGEDELKMSRKREEDQVENEFESKENQDQKGLKIKGKGAALLNFKEVMGDNLIEWLLPVGKSKNDGLSYPVNPRFTQNGRWRERKDWPSILR